MAEARPSADQASIVDQAVLDLGDAVGIARHLGLGQKGGAFGIGLQHGVEQRGRRRGHLLCHPADPRAREGSENLAALQGQFAPIRRKSVVLPVPFRPTRPTLWPAGIVADAPSNRGRPSTE